MSEYDRWMKLINANPKCRIISAPSEGAGHGTRRWYYAVDGDGKPLSNTLISGTTLARLLSLGIIRAFSADVWIPIIQTTRTNPPA